MLKRSNRSALGSLAISALMGAASLYPIDHARAEPDRGAIVDALTAEGCALSHDMGKMVLSGAAYDQMLEKQELIEFDHQIFLATGGCTDRVARIFSSNYQNISHAFLVHQCVLGEEELTRLFEDAPDSLRKELADLGDSGQITSKVDGPGHYRLLSGVCGDKLPPGIQADIDALIEAFKSTSCKIPISGLESVLQAHGLTDERAERAAIAGMLSVRTDLDSGMMVLEGMRSC